MQGFQVLMDLQELTGPPESQEQLVCPEMPVPRERWVPQACQDPRVLQGPQETQESKGPLELLVLMERMEPLVTRDL